jgi:hypothetical protein
VAFSRSREGISITIPSSVEILGDGCFENCQLGKVTFEEISNLKKIGERDFAFPLIESITIRKSTHKIDGSAFLRCLLKAIDIGPGNPVFILRENDLPTSDWTENLRSCSRNTN